MTSHQDRVVRSQKQQIYKIIEKVNNQDAYFFVLVKKSKLASFLNIPSGTSYKISDYGRVLEWGYGSEPPQAVLESLAEQYDITLKDM